MDIEILNALKSLKNVNEAPAGRKLLEPTKASKRMTRAINELYNKPANKRPLKEANESDEPRFQKLMKRGANILFYGDLNSLKKTMGGALAARSCVVTSEEFPSYSGNKKLIDQLSKSGGALIIKDMKNFRYVKDLDDCPVSVIGVAAPYERIEAAIRNRFAIFRNVPDKVWDKPKRDESLNEESAFDLNPFEKIKKYLDDYYDEEGSEKDTLTPVQKLKNRGYVDDKGSKKDALTPWQKVKKYLDDDEDSEQDTLTPWKRLNKYLDDEDSGKKSVFDLSPVEKLKKRGYTESLHEDFDASVPDWAKDEIKKTWGQSYNRGVPQGSDWDKEISAPLTDIKVVEVDDPSTLSAGKIANKNSEAFVLMPNGRVANLKKFIGKDRQDILNKAVKACYYKKLPEDSAEYQDNLAKRKERSDWNQYDRSHGRGLNGRESGTHGYRNVGNQRSYYWHSGVDKSGYYPNEEMKQLKRYKEDENRYNSWATHSDEEAQQYMKKALDATRYADDYRKQAKDQGRAYKDKIAKSKAELRAKADERKGQKK